MKKITAITAIILIMFFIMGCDKYHRDRYTGTWEFVVEKYIYEYDDLGEYVQTVHDTTFSYIGKISLGNYEKEIKIRYAEESEISVNIDEDGSFWSSPELCDGIGKDIGMYGKFENNKDLHFYLDFFDKLEISGKYVSTRYEGIKGTKKGRRSK